MTTTFVLRRTGAVLLAFSVAIALCSVFVTRADASYPISNFAVTPTTTQAAAHPNLTVSIDPDAASADLLGADDLKNVTIDAPAGMVFNQAAATTQCAATQLSTDTCPAASVVGSINVKWRTPIGGSIAGTGTVYVMTSPAGNAAALGVVVRPTNYKKFSMTAAVTNAIPFTAPTRVSIVSIPRTIQTSTGANTNVTIDQIDVTLNSNAGSPATGPSFTLNPSACTAAKTTAVFTSWIGSSVTKTSSFTPTGCPGVPFALSTSVQANDSTGGGATGFSVVLAVPQGDAPIQQSDIKGYSVDLARGSKLNTPAVSAIASLCTSSQLSSDTCPAKSIVGSASVSNNAPGGALISGTLYLMTRSASSLGLGYVMRNAALGTKVALTATLAMADVTGDSTPDLVRLSTTGIPQVPWTQLNLNVDSLFIVNPTNACPNATSSTTAGSWSGTSATVIGPWFVAPANCVPDTTITTAPPSLTAATQPSFGFTSSLAGSTFQCAWDGVAYAACTSPTTAPQPLTQNVVHTFCVRAVLGGQTDPTPACRSFRVGLLPPFAPTLTRTSPTASPTNVNSQSLSVATTEVGGTLQGSLDGAAFATISASVSLSGLADGAHTYAARVIDAAGNVGDTSSVAWTVDTVAPAPLTVSLTSPTSSPTTQTTATLAYSGAEAGASVQSSLDNPAVYAAAPTSPIQFSGLAAMTHTAYVRQVDAAGNSSAPASVSWTVVAGDPPVVTITSGPSGPTNASTVTFGFIATTSDGSTPTYECQIDGGQWSSCSPPFTLPAPPDGSHIFCVRATSANQSSGVACRSFLLDRVAPVVVISSPATGSTQGSSVQVVFSASEPSAFTCKLDSGAAAACSSPWNLTGLATGVHTATICATDPAGNAGCSSVTWSPPPSEFTVTITSGRTGIGVSTTATFAFIASIPQVNFACSFDGAPFAACVSPVTYTSLAQGSHTFCVRATDSAGTPSTNSPCQSFTVGGVILPPTVTRVSPTANPTSSTSQTLSIVLDTLTPIAEASLDGGAYATVAGGTVMLTGLADGTHTYSVRGVDTDGNRTSTTTVSWRVDTIPPPAPTVVGPTGVSTATSVTIIFSDTEAGVICQGSRDGGAFTAVTSPVALTGLTDGNHSYSVRCIDAAGNVGAATTIVWTSSIEPPPPLSLVRISPASSPSNLTSASFTISGIEPGAFAQRSLDGGPFVATTSSIALTGLPDGTHILSVREVDSAGNVGPTTSNVWTVDTVPPLAPAVVLTSPTSSPTCQTSATIAITPAEAGGSIQGSLDGSAFAPVTSPVSLTGLVWATHSYSARQVDAAGNVGSSASLVWVINCGPPPTPTITAGPSGTTASSAATFSFTGADAGGVYQCQLDGGTWTACTSPRSFSGLAQGTHTFCVRIVDASGTIGSTLCRTWTVDTVPPPAPSVTRTSPASSPTTQTTATIVFSNVESGVAFQGSLDGAAYAPVTSPVSLSALAFGTHTFSVRSVDAAGNVGPSAATTWAIAVSIAPPVVVISSPSPNYYVNGASVLVSYSVTTSDGLAPQCDHPSPYAWTGLAEGDNSITITCTDSLGQSGSAVAHVISDTTPPVITSITPADGTHTTASSVTLAITATDENGFTECFPDSSTAIDLAIGPNTIHVSCDDIVANPVSTDITIYRDSPPDAPVVSISSPQNDLKTQSSSVTLNYTVTPAGSTCDLASGSSRPLAVGANTITVNCTNQGVAGSASVSVTRGAPFSAGASCTSTGTSITCIANPSGGFAPYTSTCRVDSALVTCGVATPVSAGNSHSGQVCASDSIGTNSCLVFDFFATPPTPSCSPSGTTLVCTWTTSAGWTATCRVDGSAAFACSSPWVLSGLSTGVTHTISICFTDQSGNTTCRSYTWVPGGGLGGGGTTCPPGMICLPNDPNLPQ